MTKEEEPHTRKESKAGGGEYFAKVPNLGFNILNPSGGPWPAVLTENREPWGEGIGGSKSNLTSNFNLECQIASPLINEKTYNGRIVWLHRHGTPGNEAL
jgi:hypothetical protein